jgi:hypothetical protein
LRYEDDFYDSVCGDRPGVISMAAFEGEDMVAAMVLRCAPASNFEDSVVSTWRLWSSWDDPVRVHESADLGKSGVTALTDCLVHLHHRSGPTLQAEGVGHQGASSRVVQCWRAAFAFEAIKSLYLTAPLLIRSVFYRQMLRWAFSQCDDVQVCPLPPPPLTLN